MDAAQEENVVRLVITYLRNSGSTRTPEEPEKDIKTGIVDPDDTSQSTGEDLTLSGLNYVAVCMMFVQERHHANHTFDNKFVIDFIKPKLWAQQPLQIPGDEFTLVGFW
ncbi:uncharacterized protein PG986_002794 [Apiospora aurea]|uniref:Uncharacterized protein n=1 Tax=Apiospora aurea TaxID=335848 RepID=A0ABR1QPU7_9PEZI